jgi:hypothetical protein
MTTLCQEPCQRRASCERWGCVQCCLVYSLAASKNFCAFTWTAISYWTCWTDAPFLLSAAGCIDNENSRLVTRRSSEAEVAERLNHKDNAAGLYFCIQQRNQYGTRLPGTRDVGAEPRLNQRSLIEAVRKPTASEDPVNDSQLLHIYFTTTESTFTTSCPRTQQPLLMQVPPFSRATRPSAFFCHSVLLIATRNSQEYRVF